MAKSDVVGAILGKHKSRFLNKPANELVLPEQALGLEIEIERCPVAPNRGVELLPDEIAHYWSSHEDGSLHDNGVEFTFKEPLFGEDILNALSGFFDCGHIKRMKSSLRTGIHVHMDARDLSRHQLLGLVAYYIMFEPALYQWVADGRHANNFCIPWYKYQGSLEKAERILIELRKFSTGEVESNERALTACDAFDKYAGLNLKALGTYGSVEFRQLKTTLDYSAVKDWINILMSLKKAALDAPESTITIVNEVIRRGPEVSTARIFGERAAEKMLTEQVLKTMREITIPNALEFIDSVIDPPISAEEAKELEWKSALSSSKKETHPGVGIWRKANFPKGSGSEQAAPQPPEQPGRVGVNFEAIWRTFTAAGPGNPIIQNGQNPVGGPGPGADPAIHSLGARTYIYDLHPDETKAVIVNRLGTVGLAAVYRAFGTMAGISEAQVLQILAGYRERGPIPITVDENRVHGPCWYTYPRDADLAAGAPRRYTGVFWGEVYRNNTTGGLRTMPLARPPVDEEGHPLHLYSVEDPRVVNLLNQNSEAL